MYAQIIPSICKNKNRIVREGRKLKDDQMTMPWSPALVSNREIDEDAQSSQLNN
jgi:hypothetical protein